MKLKIGILGKKFRKFRLIYCLFYWYSKYYFFAKYSPLSCGIYITNRCNFSCRFCNLWRNPQSNTLSYLKFENIVNFLSRTDCFYLSVSGGEPFLVPDIFKMLHFAKTKIPYVHVVSNGFLMNVEFVRQLKATNLDEISISIDGLEKTHDALRNKAGAFRHAVMAIENLKAFAPEIEIVVNSIICTQNLNELPQVVRLVSQYGLKHKFQPVNAHPVFEGQMTFSDEQVFSPDDMKKLDEFIMFIRKQKNVVNSAHFLSLIPRYLRGEADGDFFSERCFFGYHHCEFNERGELFPCLTGMDWRDGFGVNGKIENTFYGDSYKKKLSELRSCQLCRKNMYICYFEPRLTFPLVNFLKYRLPAKK